MEPAIWLVVSRRPSIVVGEFGPTLAHLGERAMVEVESVANELVCKLAEPAGAMAGRDASKRFDMKNRYCAASESGREHESIVLEHTFE
ncbi:MAG: hypothetical protein ACI8Y4_000698 [Candidatus Poriferisodalaceae bacterium]